MGLNTIIFKAAVSKYKAGFFKYCAVRPTGIVTAESCGTHAACVRSAHLNVKLMLTISKLKELMVGASTMINSGKYYLGTCHM
jgi:hypothetical protein